MMDNEQSKHNNLSIKIDFREKDSNVGKILAELYGFQIIEDNLKIGDYLIGNDVIVERKTAIDFSQSIIDGRLFRQAKIMQQVFNLPLFIIEGKNVFDTSVNIHPNAVKGALVSLTLAWRIPVLFSTDYTDTALLLWLIASQNYDFHADISARPGRRPKRLLGRQLYILQGLPGVGPKLAEALLNHFGSIAKVITASDKELTDIHGLGRIKAQKIKTIVNSFAYKTPGNNSVNSVH
ncbi:MAG: hypothetical protein HY746_03850 [Elusimicrobia bacterium]|nr:hypothetical protein [Elusimicrobiota bacterium]